MNIANVMFQCPRCQEKRFPKDAVEFANYANSTEYYEKNGMRYIYVYCNECLQEDRERYVRDLLTISTW